MEHNHDHKTVLGGVTDSVRSLRAQIPDVWKGYSDLRKAAMADGELSVQTKELIALAIAIVRQCDGCIASHARGAVRQGVTAKQVAEMIGVTVLLSGGPATVYGPRAWEAFLEFQELERNFNK